MAEGSRLAKSLKNPIQWIAAGLILFALILIALGPMNGRLESPKENPFMEKARFIDLLMFAYAMDNNGKYPLGKSSTEVFQKLIDEKYTDDPSVFYYELPGKAKPSSSKLKPENVSWDITIPLDDHDSDYLPVVFLTGYKVHYVPSGNAVPLGVPASSTSEGIVVGYKSNSVVYLNNDGLSDGIVTHFISPNFDPAGKKYQQLTPNGPLSP